MLQSWQRFNGNGFNSNYNRIESLTFKEEDATINELFLYLPKGVFNMTFIDIFWINYFHEHNVQLTHFHEHLHDGLLYKPSSNP